MHTVGYRITRNEPQFADVGSACIYYEDKVWNQRLATADMWRVFVGRFKNCFLTT